MIDFGCKRFDIEEVMKCGLGLSRSEFAVLKLLVNTEQQLTTEDIARKMKIHLTTVQRAVKSLSEKKVVEKNQKNLQNGGYVFVYRAMPKTHIRKVLMDSVYGWTHRLEQELKKW